MITHHSRALLVSEQSRENTTVVGQVRSCRICRLRKVKCDRVKPCHACCAHGYPSKCVYEPSTDEGPQPISQADEIQNLRAEIHDLTTRRNNREHRHRSERRRAQLQRLFATIRSAPLEVVSRLITQLRAGPAGSNHDDSSRDSDYNASYGSDVSDLNYSSSESGDGSLCSSIISLQSSRPMLDVFVERFVDAFSPEVDIKSGQAGALRRAAEIRMFSPILMDAFEAVSVAFFGRSVQDPRIESSGFYLYPRVLRHLQHALQDPERSKAESTLATVILLMAFESVERTTQGSLVAHVHGALRLIEHRGPDTHIHGVEHLLFTELRPYWVGAALFNRQPSFLAQEDWINLPWSTGTTKKDILHYLLDLTVKVPALQAEYDALEATLESEVPSEHEIAVKQASLWNDVSDLTSQFIQWKRDWVDAYPDGPPQEVPAEPNDQFPIFRCRDLRTGAVITPTKFVYPDLRLAQTMCLYYTSRLVLSSVDTRPTDRVGPMQQYALGCGICRSLEWYILTAPGNMINRLAFSVRVAWEVFPDGGPERRFIYQVLKLVQKRHSLGLWGHGMSELSTRAGSPPKV
ncbi:C6 finger domain-containing protein [Aspergillus coremiiformis]|uniref:C6 finger domain-containing protein n=1 Tax=Aspergillus coremiiformis TaxID=138285 RepID=A0A5N6ZH48_9EURO|nr:C6 finger domain-containing protein [Aspergillus coremiiformis]